MGAGPEVEIHGYVSKLRSVTLYTAADNAAQGRTVRNPHKCRILAQKLSRRGQCKGAACIRGSEDRLEVPSPSASPRRSHIVLTGAAEAPSLQEYARLPGQL